MHRGRFLAVLAAAALVVVAISGLAVEVVGDAAVGALLGVLVVLAALGLRQQARYARKTAADLAAVSEALASMNRSTKTDVAGVSKKVAGVSQEVAGLSRTVTAWSKNVKVAEIEAGVEALNRYVALGSDDTAHGA